MSRVNRYPGKCRHCYGTVPKNGGRLVDSGDGQWAVEHLACGDAGGAAVSVFHFPGGDDGNGVTVTQNSNGRCIDAPCCGCCT